MPTNVDIFTKYRQLQAYGTQAINELLNYSEEQSSAIYRAQIIPLLKATKRFRNIADPGLFFSTIRAEEDNSDYLIQVMEEITAVFSAAEAAGKQSPLVISALVYCAESINQRVQELDPNDKIRKIYSYGTE